jgi:poly-gamma-glutamate capsule biosynthesis protein CapA/YwtB (metallophosphatase superfamily)
MARLRFRLIGTLAALPALVVAACGSPTATESAPAPSSSPTTPQPSPTPVHSPSPTPEPGPVTIAFGGDVHFESQLRSRLNDPATALDPIATQLSAADLTVLNLETSIGASGVREPKRYAFQAPPTALEALAHAGVDVVTMANNHGMDYGARGLADSLAAAASAASANPPLSVVGIGTDTRQAFAPAVRDVRGTTVAVIGASSADDPTADPTAQWAATDDRAGIAVAADPARLVKAVTEVRRGADVVVVYLHWGIQGERCPSDSQVAMARALAAAGADIVVGTHAHVVQGAGLLNETYVAYGLGNFVWYNQGSDAASTTGVLTLTVDDGRVVDEAWSPARIQADGLPRFIAGAEGSQLTAAFAAQRDCTELRPLTP